MTDYYTILLFLGLAVAAMAFIPIHSSKYKISYTIPLLLLGCTLYVLKIPLPWPDPLWSFNKAKIITEIIVIISLMVAGLKIGIHYNLKDWMIPFRLIGITMIFSMLSVFLISHYILNLNGPVSLLLAAVLAPTDPVMASELQLEDHQKIDDKNTGLRFALTSEAGINDGLAFPFVYLAISWSKAGSFQNIDFTENILYYFIYKIFVGIFIGAIIGFAVSYLIKTYSKENRKLITNGFLAVALTFVSYGAAEFLKSYGFLSVFATGVFLQYYNRSKESDVKKNVLINFAEQTEKLLSVLWTIFFGGSIVSGILNYTDLNGILLSIAFVLIIRPVFGYLALLKTKYSRAKRFAIAFFGIRGIGSFFYLSFALLKGKFQNYDDLFGIVSYIVLFSIILHGLTSIRVIDYFKKP